VFDPTNPTGSQYRDPFSGALNPLNATSGNWGIDPMYITPGYTANLRPQYQGSHGYSAMSYSPSIGESLTRSLPFPTSPRVPMYMDSMQYQRQLTDSIAFKSSDNAAGFAQNFVAPFAAYAAGEALTSGRVRSMKDGTTTMAGAWAALKGGSSVEQLTAMTTRSMSGAMGAGMSGGAMGGLIRGFGGSSARHSVLGKGMVGASRLLGGMAGRLAVPLMVGQGLMNVAEQAIFDPYVGVRQGQDSMLRNFSNQYVGDGGGRVTGFGLSRHRAAGIGRKMAMDSAKDFSFEVGDYGKIADYSSRAGMLNDIKDFDVDTITKRVKGIANQVKMVMKVANEPSLQEAVKMLANLKTAGATDSGGFAGKVLSGISSNAAISGMSTREMINTVGATGQYLYQSQGLTPFVGMQNAASMHAGFSSAFRTGLIDPALMARMGGMQGMTQSAMEGQVGLARSNYNMMGLANQHLFGQSTGGGFAGNISRFGGNFAQDPTNTMGMMGLFGNDMVSAQLKNDPTSVMGQIFDYMGAAGMKNTAGNFAYASSQFGLDENKQRAMLEMIQSGGDEDAAAYRSGALKGKRRKNLMSTMSQNDMDFLGSSTGRGIRNVRGAWRGISEGGASVMGRSVEAMSYMADAFDESLSKFRYGNLDAGEYMLGRRVTGENIKGLSEKTGLGLDINKAITDNTQRIKKSMYGDGLSRAEVTQLNADQKLLSKYKDRFSKSNGTTDQKKLANALKSGNTDEIFRSLSKLGFNSEEREEIIKNKEVFATAVNSDMVLKGSTSDMVAGYEDDFGKALGKGYNGSLDMIGQGALVSDIATMAGSGDIGNLISSEAGQALTKRMVAAGILKEGSSLSDAEEAMMGVASRDFTYGAGGRHSATLNKLIGGAGSTDELLEEYKKNPNSPRFSKLDRASKAELNSAIRSGDTSKAKNALQAAVLNYSQMMGDGHATEDLNKLGTEGIESLLTTNMSELGSEMQIRETALKMKGVYGKLDMREFENMKQKMSSLISDKQLDAAEMQVTAALINKGLASDQTIELQKDLQKARNEGTTSE